MKLGTVVYHDKIYNLDYMTAEETKELLKKIDEEKNASFKKAKDMVKEK